MSKISVTRALAQVKSLTDRIQRGTQAQFIVVSVGSKVAGKPSEDEAKQFVKANLQTVRDLIALRTKLKSAIVKSNSTTQVTIGGVSMTVAEAIERKSSIVLEQNLLHTMITQQANAVATVERLNVDVARRSEEAVGTLLGRDRKTDDEDCMVVARAIEAKSKAVLLDENKLDTLIPQMTLELDQFLLEVDFALSEINATTQIEVA